MSACFMRYGGESLDLAQEFVSTNDAKDAYEKAATQLFSYEQRVEASIHCVGTRAELVDDYPDYVLSLGRNGGVKFDAARCPPRG